MASGLFHMYKFMWPFAEVHLVLCSHDTCFQTLTSWILQDCCLIFLVCVSKATIFWALRCRIVDGFSFVEPFGDNILSFHL